MRLMQSASARAGMRMSSIFPPMPWGTMLPRRTARTRKARCSRTPAIRRSIPTCIPVTGDHQAKLTLMSESLRNDGRVWVPRQKADCRAPHEIPEEERDYYLERKYPAFGNLAPRDIASRAAKEVCDEGRGVGASGRGVFLDFADSISRLGEQTIRERYGNLFDMYEKITDENAYQRPMRIYPGAPLRHGRPLGGL